METRDHEGYKQMRDGGNWQFIICGFDWTRSGQAGFCYVLKADGTQEKLPINGQDRVLINGKRYGRKHWHH